MPLLDLSDLDTQRFEHSTEQTTYGAGDRADINRQVKNAPPKLHTAASLIAKLDAMRLPSRVWRNNPANHNEVPPV